MLSLEEQEVCFYLLRPAVYLHCPLSGIYQLSISMSEWHRRDFDHLSPPQDIMLAHYIHDIMLIVPGDINYPGYIGKTFACQKVESKS